MKAVMGLILIVFVFSAICFLWLDSRIDRLEELQPEISTTLVCEHINDIVVCVEN